MNLDHLSFPDSGWGYLPPTEKVFEAFRYCQNSFRPKCVLEIGFHIGHSTTYQLEIYNQANVVGVSPDDEKPRTGRNGLEDSFLSLRNEMESILRKRYDNRFEWVRGKTESVLKKLESYSFDFALIDGNHTYKSTVFDLKTCRHLGIKHFLVDNMERNDVYLACKEQTRILKMWEYDVVFKGKPCTNKIALCTN